MSKQVKKAILVEGEVQSTLIRLTIPMVFGILAIVGFGLVDSYFISLLGTNELAAVGFTFPVGMVLTNVAIGLGVGVASVLSRIIGGGDSQRAQRIATDSIFLAVILVSIISVLGILTIDPLFTLLGAVPEVLSVIKEYMVIYYLAVPFLVVPIVGNSAIRATGDTVTPAKIMVLAAFGNAVLDPLLIFGLFGFPELGIRGAAYATLFGWMFSTVWAMWILRRREHLLTFEKPKWAEVLHSWRDVLYIGVPAAATYCLAPVASGILIVIVANYGTEAVAAFGVSERIRPIAAIVALGLSSSLPVFIGQNFGAERHDRVAESIRVSIKLIVITQLIVTVLLFSLSKPIALAFSKEPEVISLIISMLMIIPISYLGLGIAIICSSAFNAVNKPYYAMVMNVARLFLCLLPMAWLGSVFYGLNGLFWGITIGYLAAGLIAVVWMRKEFLQLESLEAASDVA
ncbi:MAG: MATE family efflux transporter [Gammaproteobacteria bacterium]|nr:MATE family efflux transporter [Gammaproteobacteria bacterium]